jgi:hypothetical protein
VYIDLNKGGLDVIFNCYDDEIAEILKNKTASDEIRLSTGRNIANFIFPLRFDWELKRMLGFIYSVYPPSAEPINDVNLQSKRGHLRIVHDIEKFKAFKGIEKLRTPSVGLYDNGDAFLKNTIFFEFEDTSDDKLNDLAIYPIEFEFRAEAEIDQDTNQAIFPMVNLKLRDYDIKFRKCQIVQNKKLDEEKLKNKPS